MRANQYRCPKGPEVRVLVRLRLNGKQYRWRPYRVECTGSLPTSEVKRRRARLVLGWGAAREDLRVLPALLHRNVAPCQFGIRLFHSIVLSLSLSLSFSLFVCSSFSIFLSEERRAPIEMQLSCCVPKRWQHFLGHALEFYVVR